jgi:dolichol-phosphate mannosyltransferase
MTYKLLTSLPVFNEVQTVNSVLDEVQLYCDEVLVVDDGSTDGSSELLAKRTDIHLVRHPQNRGYGAALMTAFQYAADHDYDLLVTIDCDGQHQPKRIREFADTLVTCGADIVSGSRYFKTFDDDTVPPIERRRINETITQVINQKLGFELTDAFCGFKAYRVSALKQLKITETGYAMPLELWVQVACAGLTVIELPVPLIYLDPDRSFGGPLDQAEIRLKYYFEVLNRAFATLPDDCDKFRGIRIG